MQQHKRSMILRLLERIQTARYLHSRNKNKKIKISFNLPRKLLLIHLPSDILSKIILELLTEWSILRTLFTTYPRGLLDLYDNMPELPTNRMIPLSQVNKFFYELVWITTFEYSYWDQMSGIRLGYSQSKSFIKTVPLVFDKTMLKSRGIEPVDRFLITGPLCQKQHKFVKNLMLDNFEFLLSSVGTGLQRSFIFPNLQFLTTLVIYLEFVNCSTRNHEKIEQEFSEYWMSQHCSFNDTGIELPLFVEVELNQKTTDQTVCMYVYEICFYSCLLSYYMLINVDYTITYFLPIPSTVPRTRARSELLNVSLVPPRVEFYTALPVSIVGRY